MKAVAYIGTYTDGKREGIHLLEIDTGTEPAEDGDIGERLD